MQKINSEFHTRVLNKDDDDDDGDDDEDDNLSCLNLDAPESRD